MYDYIDRFVLQHYLVMHREIVYNVYCNSCEN